MRINKKGVFINPRGKKTIRRFVDFKLLQPHIDYAERLERLKSSLSEKLSFVSEREFAGKSRQLLKKLAGEKNLSGLLSGIYLPIVLPGMVIRDYGLTMEKIFLKGVRSSYKKFFPGREYYQYCRNNMKGNVSIAWGSRHDFLIKQMASGPVVGILMLPFRGWSGRDCRKAMKKIDNSLLLSGGIDIATAMIMYPDVLARDYLTPGIDFSAISGKSKKGSFAFWACGSELEMIETSSIKNPYEYYTSGVLLI